jgi:uncharacterized membrane protein AbrB (regulator of aidB expression)
MLHYLAKFKLIVLYIIIALMLIGLSIGLDISKLNFFQILYAIIVGLPLLLSPNILFATIRKTEGLKNRTFSVLFKISTILLSLGYSFLLNRLFIIMFKSDVIYFDAFSFSLILISIYGYYYLVSSLSPSSGKGAGIAKSKKS